MGTCFLSCLLSCLPASLCACIPKVHQQFIKIKVYHYDEVNLQFLFSIIMELFKKIIFQGCVEFPNSPIFLEFHGILDFYFYFLVGVDGFYRYTTVHQGFGQFPEFHFHFGFCGAYTDRRHEMMMTSRTVSQGIRHWTDSDVPPGRGTEVCFGHHRGVDYGPGHYNLISGA